MSNFLTPWTVAHQVPLFMKFSRQESENKCFAGAVGSLTVSQKKGIKDPERFQDSVFIFMEVASIRVVI